MESRETFLTSYIPLRACENRSQSVIAGDGSCTAHPLPWELLYQYIIHSWFHPWKAEVLECLIGRGCRRRNPSVRAQEGARDPGSTDAGKPDSMESFCATASNPEYGTQHKSDRDVERYSIEKVTRQPAKWLCRLRDEILRPKECVKDRKGRLRSK